MKFISTLLFVFLLQYASANTFYISPAGDDDKGTGSMGNPWKTLSKATMEVTTAGDIIHVLPGFYTEKIRCTLAPGVSIEGEGETSVIQSTLAEAYVPIIVATSPEGTNGNQHISNIKLDGNKRTTSWAVEIRGRSNFSMYNCIVVDFEDTGIFWGGRNDNNAEAPKIYATGNSFYNNTVINCAKYDGYGRGCLAVGGQEGMLIYNNTISQTGRPHGTNGWPIKGCNDGFLKGCKIYNNKITKQAYDGTSWDFAIELFDVSGLEIYGNTIVGSIDMNRQTKGGYAYSTYIHDNTIGPLNMQRRMESGIILEYGTETAIIEKNIFRNIGTGVMFSCRALSNVTDVVIKDNRFENIGVADGSHKGYGVYFISDGTASYAVENFTLNNNQFIASSKEQPYFGVCFSDAGKANNIFIRNNTFKNFSAACVSANPAGVIDSIFIENNVLSGNGFVNRPSFTGGGPLNLFFRNNKTENGTFFTKANIKQNIARPFYYDIKRTSLLEFIAVIAGILSVWFSKKENIYVYPVGLINTVIFIFLSLDQSLFGEASVNLYYTIMSIYGWIIWSKRDRRHHRLVRVTKSTQKEWMQHLGFFAAFYIVIFFSLTYLKNNFAPGAVPWADAFASATAFTGMWLMTKKKVESWYWWIATNIASIPLYFVKHFVLTSVYYGVLLVLAYMGLQEWKKRSRTTKVFKNKK